MFSRDFVRELRFATSVEGTWWKRSVFERDLAAIWPRDGRDRLRREKTI
jgi:hypothetical protein